ncbi:2657_t:CDS:2 [Diversispora eburnea]|uniref:2657_t:CDS:1 n=1 Tax=Diversispora eburnea TaxID=1213867 RepID=A0A9N9CBV6_9GLOM|nr:2657_t:CDS:2 [Diversispora eburnea]
MLSDGNEDYVPSSDDDSRCVESNDDSQYVGSNNNSASLNNKYHKYSPYI